MKSNKDCSTGRNHLPQKKNPKKYEKKPVSFSVNDKLRAWKRILRDRDKYKIIKFERKSWLVRVINLPYGKPGGLWISTLRPTLLKNNEAFRSLSKL